MVDVARSRKLAERIKVLVAEALANAVKDSDLGFVTITDVKVTPDLQHSTIYYTVYGSAEDKQRSAEIIERNDKKFVGIESNLATDYYLWLTGKAGNWFHGENGYSIIKPTR